MYYKYNKKTLTFEKVNWVKTILKFASINLLVVLFVITNVGLSVPTPTPTEEQLVIINKNINEFSEEKLVEEIKKRNFKYPYIVHAQSILETGEFTSPIFKENNNLFGMKQAMVRTNVALGTKRGHAYYENWQESVEDYAYYYASYLFREVDNSEEEYYQYLNAKYAEAKNYDLALQRVVKDYNLKELYGFND